MEKKEETRQRHYLERETGEKKRVWEGDDWKVESQVLPCCCKLAEERGKEKKKMAFLINAMEDVKKGTREKVCVCVKKGYVCTRLKRADDKSSHQRKKKRGKK